MPAGTSSATKVAGRAGGSGNRRAELDSGLSRAGHGIDHVYCAKSSSEENQQFPLGHVVISGDAGLQMSVPALPVFTYPEVRGATVSQARHARASQPVFPIP
jgi:hypothetical protein